MDKEPKLRNKIANDFYYELQNSPRIINVSPDVKEMIIITNFNYDESYFKNITKKMNQMVPAFFKIQFINRDFAFVGDNLNRL